jgi:GT2 family glycosyltransferase
MMHCKKNLLPEVGLLMDVSIITRVFNNSQMTKECIESVRKNTVGVRYEHIVVNNGSADETSEYLRTVEGIILVDNDKNLGCAAGLNSGIAKASGKYICNLDNDVIVSQNWLKPMLEIAESRHEIGIVSPGTREGIPDYDFETYACEYKKRMKNVTEKRFGGWCMLIKRDVFDKIGTFSEEFNMYCEDTDFYFRMKQAGYEAITTGASFVHHRVNATLSAMPGKKQFEQGYIIKLRKKWNVKDETYVERKIKSFYGFVKKTYLKLFYGHLLLERR